ncbi:MAG TPA: VWA domain-containing protein [Pyrinomonadaceae bacterium]|nr:VWA domain-containing protein [Pyrinomonadaceae bacterium]
MSKYPASKSHARADACALALAFVALVCPPLLTQTRARADARTDARQDAEATKEQAQKPARRPRRVGPATTKENGETPAPTPARRDDAPSGARVAEEVGEDDVVKVETQLISVPTVVTDREGKPLTGLRAENFVLFEDGRPQKIANFATTEAPFEVALLLDTSGSTRADVGLIRRAARAFIDALRTGDRLAIVSYTTKEEGDTKLAAVEVMTYLTDDRDALRDAVEMIGTSAGTPFYDSLERVARDIFRDPPRDELRGRRALVALSDGIDSTSDSDFDEARERLKRVGVVCYFVQLNTEDYVEERLMRDCQDDGALRLSRRQLARYRRIFAPRADAADFEDFCRMGQFERMDISRRLYQMGRQEMNELAKDTGGKTFPIADLTDARRAFRQVAEEIGTQYSLGYYSTNKARDGSFRAIRVQVRGVKDAQVRAREGYQVPRG